jgi:nucleotide-binding universal stress UspA family protein
MYRTIVVGTDGSTTAEAATAHAIELARRLGAALHVVSARRPDPVYAAAPEAGAVLLEPDHGALTAEILDAAAGRAREEGVATETYAPLGAPASCLIDVARQVGADLLVVGSRGMHGARRFIGSTPNRVSHHAPCHVLVVHTT